MTWTFIQLVFSIICVAGAEYYVYTNGEKANEGNVQINDGSTWFDLCTDGWDDTDATVVCRMLGYTGGGATASINANGSTFSSMVQYKFDCDGTETSLQDCQTSSSNQTVCQNSSFSHVSCAEIPVPSDFFLLTFDASIAKMDRASGSLSLVQNGFLGELRAITYDSLQGNIIWTDIQLNQIALCALNGGETTVIYQAGNGSKMDGIAMDVTSRLIFYTDTGYDEIGFINADTFVKTIVVDTNLDEPRAIVLDTQTREIFWTDWGTSTAIEKSNYDGSNRTTIVSTGLGWPNAMVLDGDLLIWCDAKNDVYEQVHRGGTGRTTLRTLIGSQCFDFILFEDYLYVNDFHYQQIVRVKTDGTQSSLYGPLLSKRYGIYHHIQGNTNHTNRLIFIKSTFTIKI
ncbi:low-density lipoprotein receptor-related protein 4-like [Mizuhopecten yessoensis]|uniref:low-density lipoprotein receptor-related protein 4-like n=1 Tax=Mizuhopecten yessoensis TaxID=6573 RepID=UPI000B45AE95|nr:low-density lipoprotein receptor-related protein 4-like [Mizuhopecten yessoensis]